MDKIDLLLQTSKRMFLDLNVNTAMHCRNSLVPGTFGRNALHAAVYPVASHCR